MIEELQLINLWIEKKETGFLSGLGLDKSYFFVYKPVVEWIEGFINKTGKVPSMELVASEFPDDFRKIDDIDPVDYLTTRMREQKAYTEYRPLLINNAKMLESGNTLEAIWQMRNNLDKILQAYSGKMTRYDWVKDALVRYEKYMENHGKEGIAGIDTGFTKLNEITGGWLDDDLVLISARVNEGKSLVAGWFAYHAWKHMKSIGRNDPIIYISTEMPEIQIAYRLDTLRRHFSNSALRFGKLNDTDAYREYLEELQKKDTSLLILSQDANGGKPFTPNDIRAIIESEKPCLLVIDQLYDIADPSGEKDIRKCIVNNTRAIRDINLHTMTPTILVAQAGREAAVNAKKSEEATPELHQIQESDSPAQKSTRVLTLRLVNNELFKFTLRKNRDNRRDDSFYVRANIDNGMWEEVTEETSVF